MVPEIRVDRTRVRGVRGLKFAQAIPLPDSREVCNTGSPRKRLDGNGRSKNRGRPGLKPSWTIQGRRSGESEDIALDAYALNSKSTLEAFDFKLAAPFAVLGVRIIGERLTGIEYLPSGVAALAPRTPFAREVCRQLRAYLKNPTFAFDLPFQYSGTDFQNRVWRIVHAIPSGQTLSYAQVARMAQTFPRPVGMACGANRLPLVIPCHRVVASQGLGGFMHATRGRAIEVKRWLLSHEGAPGIR